MGRIERGFRLARASLEVLRSDRELMILPVVSTVAILVFSAAVLSPVFISGFGGNRTALYVLLAVVYFFSTFIATLSNAALVAAATDRMTAWGKTPVRCASTPGFIVNRVARPFYGEAQRLLMAGAADAATSHPGLRRLPTELSAHASKPVTRHHQTLAVISGRSR